MRRIHSASTPSTLRDNPVPKIASTEQNDEYVDAPSMQVPGRHQSIPPVVAPPTDDRDSGAARNFAQYLLGDCAARVLHQGLGGNPERLDRVAIELAHLLRG